MNKIGRNLIKIVLIVIIAMTLLGNTNIYAETYDPIENPDKFKPNYTNETPLVDKAGDVLGIINAVGVICSVIVLIIIGIKYMVGSIEEKAEYKKTMWMYILGMALLFSSTTIPNIIYKMFF